jgi:biotin operon repressor
VLRNRSLSLKQFALKYVNVDGNAITELAKSKDLAAVGLYLILKSRACLKERVVATKNGDVLLKTNQAWVSYRNIADELGISRNYLKKLISKLEESQVIGCEALGSLGYLVTFSALGGSSNDHSGSPDEQRWVTTGTMEGHTVTQDGSSHDPVLIKKIKKNKKNKKNRNTLSSNQSATATASSNSNSDSKQPVTNSLKDSSDSKKPYYPGSKLFFTDSERSRLIEKLGELCVDYWVGELEDYSERKPKEFSKYVSHFKTLLTWHKREINKPGTPVFFTHPTLGPGFYSAYVVRQLEANL